MQLAGLADKKCDFFNVCNDKSNSVLQYIFLSSTASISAIGGLNIQLLIFSIDKVQPFEV